MKTEHIVLTISIQAAAALAKKRFVTSGGAVPAAGAWCPGVTNASYDAGEQAGAAVVQAVKRAGFDQGFDGAAVDVGFVHAHAEIEEAGVCAVGCALIGDGIDGRLPCAFNCAQTVADGLGVTFAFA